MKRLRPKLPLAAAAVVAAAVGTFAGLKLTESSTAAWKGTLSASIAAASSGDTITVPAGQYPGETIGPEAKTLTVKAAGASFGGLVLAGVKNLTFDGVAVNGQFTLRAYPILGSVAASAQITGNVTVTNADLKVFLLRNVDGVTIKDSRVGGQNVSTSGLSVAKVGGYPSTPYRPSRNVVIQNVFFHDVLRTVVGGTHAECLFLDGGTDGVTVRDSWFTNCAVMDIFGGGPTASGGIANVTIQSNLMDIPRDTTGNAAPYAFNIKGGATNIVLRQNSVLGSIRFDAAAYPGKLLERNALTGFVSASQASCNLNACFRNDLHVTSGTDGVPKGGGPPPPPPPPPPVTTATTTTPPPAGLNVREISRTATVITVGWTPQPNTVGYVFLRDGVRVSSTFDPALDNTRFALTPGAVYVVRALGKLDEGSVTG